MIRQFTCALALTLFLGSAAIHAQEDWAQFRGPAGSGVASSSDSIPTQWSPNANLAWSVDLPGPGASSPIIVGDKAFVTCYSGYGLDQRDPGDMENLMRHLVCVDTKSGKILWQKDVKAALPEDPYTGAGVPAHGYASHTPVSDGKNVYAFFGKSGVHAFDMDGKELWQADVGKESDPTKWGSSSSPILHDNMVIITASAESQSVIGLNKETGEEMWRQEAEMLDGMWGTPSIVKVNDDRTDLVLSVAKEMWGMDPSTGELRWQATATNSQHAYTSLILDGTKAYAFTGRGGGSVAINVGGEGDVSESNVIWKGKDTASFASPVQHKDRLYLVSRNVVSWIDAESGERLGRVRLEGPKQTGGRFGSLDYASPIVIGDRLYYLNGSGQMFVFDLGEEVKQIAVNQVNSEKETFWGSPAVANGQLIMRSDKRLYCVTEKGEQVSDEDMQAAKAEPADEPPAEGGGRRGGGRRSFDPMSMFNNLDSDKDGSISEEELEGNQMADRLKTLDKDGDKAISKDEFTSGISGLFRRSGRGGGRSGYGATDTRPDRPQRPKAAGG